MLVELHLRNLGLIADAGVELSPGLNVFTGETGVGKTLLVGSLALLVGGRGQGRLVAAGSGEALVEAVIAVPPELRDRLNADGVEVSDELVLARRLGADGRSRGWVDGRIVPLATLGIVGECLIELHGQGSGFALATAAAQLRSLDALAGNSAVLETYRAAWRRLRALERERETLATDERTRLREADFLSFQIEEIDGADLEPDEDERIAVELGRLEHAERLGRLAQEVIELAGPDGAAGAIAQAHHAFEPAGAIDPTAAPLVSRLAALAAESTEVAWDVRAWAEGLDADPSHLETLRERRAFISNLKRKYGASIDEIIAARDEARERLASLEDADARIAEISAEEDAARRELERVGGELSKRRRRAGTKLTKLVSSELPALALPNAVFDVTCTPSEATENGADKVEFRFSSSAARAPDLIGKIASGGELSRAMIAVTLALAQAHAVPILVFDEADQGIGGEAALEVARRLARLGCSHQVLVVTHLPQIAAFADRHVAVRRSDDDVEVEVLDESGRLAELSRMLAGLESSEAARAHAAELVELARDERSPVGASPGAGGVPRQ